MAELNVSRPGDGEPVRRIDPDHQLPESTGAPPPGTIAEVDDPELARLQIEQTRARMSDTIEQIESSLLHKKEEILQKKEEIEDRLDVISPLRRTARENPVPAAVGVFLAGLALGWLTGGGDDDEEATAAVRRFAPDFDRERAYVDHWEERSRTWERRARRLMEVANRQEQELMEARGETVPVRRRFGGGGASRKGPRRAGGLDGMPLPPRGEEDPGYGYDPLPAPV
jgi:hypothetical protein